MNYQDERARQFRMAVYETLRHAAQDLGVTHITVSTLVDRMGAREGRVRRALDALVLQGMVTRSSRKSLGVYRYGTVEQVELERESQLRRRDRLALERHGTAYLLVEKLRHDCHDLVLQASHAKARPAHVEEALTAVQWAIETIGKGIGG